MCRGGTAPFHLTRPLPPGPCPQDAEAKWLADKGALVDMLERSRGACAEAQAELEQLRAEVRHPHPLPSPPSSPSPHPPSTRRRPSWRWH